MERSLALGGDLVRYGGERGADRDSYCWRSGTFAGERLAELGCPMASLSGWTGGEDRLEVLPEPGPELCSDLVGLAGEGERRLHVDSA